ncbi:DUF423 domain-containing protein [Leeuwenhoekiella marinoflava]|uniref:Uncharacterized membrane protein YgdD, TMEM256/DUF423 family n=2 Tax=Leeuwenhoekiella marinoflava TaxID=988 RepID=A0ABY1HUL8_9FLAO|nr:DUF423 domain-containing protein [Leeuwenhoekiella marinoflava]RXG27565.1 putative membrane protein YgdD (TMEM256/DUF423 family) [Leeuwenhoekiella marinoflava]SHF65788.1 Uncharacterized membrane protein YgdD, TMEM256/DUF423 family [Leeuwenhoekiella marinoflava DSM 3653]
MQVILLSQVFAALYGFLGILLGAFGAHALKKKFTPEQMASFETGIKYQMYHAIVLLVLSFNLGFTSTLDQTIIICFIVGTFLFSFSIYGLCLTGAFGKKLRLLGPVTPLGGFFLASGWLLLLYSFLENFI